MAEEDIRKIDKEVESIASEIGGHVEEMIKDAIIPFGKDSVFFSIRPSMIAGAACILTSYEGEFQLLGYINRILASDCSDELKINKIKNLVVEHSYSISKKRKAISNKLNSYGINSNKIWLEGEKQKE